MATNDDVKPSHSPDEGLKRARSLMRSGDFDSAVPLLRELVQTPDAEFASDVAVTLAVALWRGGDLVEPEQLLRGVLEAAAESGKQPAAANLGSILHMTGRTHEGMKYLRQAINGPRLDASTWSAARLAEILEEAPTSTQSPAAGEIEELYRRGTESPDADISQNATLKLIRLLEFRGAAAEADRLRLSLPLFVGIQDYLRQARTTIDLGEASAAPIGADVAPAISHLSIAARRLDAVFGLLPWSHLSIVLYADNRGFYEYGGNPQSQNPVAFGRIVVTKRSFRPRPDRQGFTVPLPLNVSLSEAEAIFDTVIERLNLAAIPYVAFGPNSNTVARTLLLALGMEPLQPAEWAPGFERDAL